MRRYSLFLLLPALFFLLQSCAPAPVFRMNPATKQTTFYEGTEYVHKFKNGIEFTLSYDRHYGDQFAMEVEIVNHTDSALRIKPSQFWYDAYKYYNGLADPADSNLIIAKRRAVSPEKEILKKDLAISRSHAHQKTSNLLYGIGEALTLTAGIISDSTYYQQAQTTSTMHNIAANHAVGTRNRAFDRQSLKDQRRSWQLNTIRTTDLLPDEYIRGLVFFKNDPDARGYMFHYKIGSIQFRAFFIQKKFKP